MSDQTMFPERELIDMSFMDHIRFHAFVPTTKPEVDKAIQEFNCLVTKSKELSAIFDKAVSKLTSEFETLHQKISVAKDSILSGVKCCIDDSTNDMGVLYDEDDKCEIDFQHGKIILEKTTTTKLKIKPIKEN